MKKLIAGLVLMLMSAVSYAATYECTGYIDGTLEGEPIEVIASKKAIAETKALDRMRKVNKKVNYVVCK